MSVESIQCPKCGGPLSVEEGRDSMYCSHCGASLRISTGSSGHAMATLADIKTDTSIIAISAALAQLEDSLHQQEAELQGLEIQRAARAATLAAHQRKATDRRQAAQHRAFGVILGLVACGLGVSITVVTLTQDAYTFDACLVSVSGLALVGLGIAVILRPFLRPIAPNRNLEEQVSGLDSRIDKCMAEIERSRVQRTALAGKMEGLTDQL